MIWKEKLLLFPDQEMLPNMQLKKPLRSGAKVVTLSDSSGYIYDPDGIDAEKLAYVYDLKFNQGRIKEYAEKYGVDYLRKKKPWGS